MKTHQFLKGGYVKLNTPFYMDSNLITDDKWIQDESGDFTIYRFDEHQQQVMANFLIGKINELVEQNISRLVKEAKEYVGEGKDVK